jgi:hypothetical protein
MLAVLGHCVGKKTYFKVTPFAFGTKLLLTKEINILWLQ